MLEVRPRPGTRCDASRWQNWNFDYLRTQADFEAGTFPLAVPDPIGH